MRSFVSSIFFVFFLGTLAVGTAGAEVRANTLNLSPMVGFQVFDGGLDLDDSEAFGLSLGYNINRNWAMEIDVRTAPTSANVRHGQDVDVVTGTLNALYHVSPEKDFVPYLAAGAGFLQYKADDDGDDNDLVANLGGGFKYALGRNVDLRFDARYLLDFRVDGDLNADDDSKVRHQLSTMVGLNFQFGDSSPAPTAAPIEPTVTKTATVATPAPVDSDADGVLDPADKCPDTAPGVRVDGRGCPADSDGDGVADFRDACLDTPKGAKVDDKGCPFVVKPVQTMNLRLVYATNKDQVTPFHYRELDRAAAFIKQYPGHDIVIEGHTDSKGDDEFNLKLSQRRAENVRMALIEKYGVEATRITAQGFGESRPVAANETADGREQNRRVVISIMP